MNPELITRVKNDITRTLNPWLSEGRSIWHKDFRSAVMGLHNQYQRHLMEAGVEQGKLKEYLLTAAEQLVAAQDYSYSNGYWRPQSNLT